MKGVYVLIIQLSEDTIATVGALGNQIFKQGLYAYVGSAQTNLEKRVQRHLRGKKRRFWHIDHLLNKPAAKIVKVFFNHYGKPQECAIAREIGKHGESVLGFGCSDCHCPSHLFQLTSYEFLQDFVHELNIGTRAQEGFIASAFS